MKKILEKNFRISQYFCILIRILKKSKKFF